MIQREFPSYSEDSPPPSEGYVFKYQSDSDDEENSEPGIPYDAIIQSNQSENHYDNVYETVNRYFDHVTRNRIWEDSDYMTWLNIQTPPIIPSINNPEQDIIAMVIGIFMAKGETLDTGLTAEEFDLQLKECTGSRNNTEAYCIRMNELLSYMKPTEEEFQKCMKDKANILLHPMFSSILEYSTGTDRFKFKIPDILQNIHDSIKASGTAGHRRRDKAEKVKFDRMEDPINRQKYMITNNFLVLLINEVFDRTNDYEAPWQKIQNLFREMMEEEENHNDLKIRNIYIKYNASLGLKKLKSTNGCELNAAACRELLGRGTPSKAISHPIYRKITWRNDPKKGLCLRLDGDLKQIYSERDFIDVQKEMDAANGIKKERFKEYKINNTKSKKELQRMQEEAEQEERKKYYVPTGINDANVFIPNNQESTFFGGNQVRQENQSQNMNQDNDYDEPCYNEENDYMYDDHYAMRDGRTENVFGQMDYVDDGDISSASEEVIDHGPNFTDEEETYQKPEPKKKEKKESTRIIETEGYVKACRNRPVENVPRQPPRPSNFPPKQSKLTVNQPKPTPMNPYAEVNIRESYRSPTREERTTIPSSSIFNPLMANSRPISTRPHGAILANSTSSLASRLRIQSTGGPVNQSIFNAGQTETLDKEEFLNYLRLHVYFHRTIEGSPKRYWSSIQKYLSHPFTSPELIFGNDWLDSLHAMSIIVVPTKNDILFEWNDEVL